MTPQLRRRAIPALLVLGAVVASACNDGAKRSSIVVSAATSLGGAFPEIARAFERDHKNVTVELNFGASSVVATQIINGAPADVFASADAASMDTVSKAKLTGVAPRVFARNQLVIITKPGNPAHVRGLADLAHVGIVSLCGAEVPCGKYAQQALDRAGVSIPESSVTRGQNSAATLTTVADGDAVAGVVYVTDAAANAKVETVAVPAAQNVTAQYFVAALKASRSNDTANAFVRYVLSGAGQKVLRRFGFRPPS